jgi:osmotically-inducible protein OsmY
MSMSDRRSLKAEKSMNIASRARVWCACFLAIGALSGCATIEKCGVEGCASDRKVTAKVEALLNAHPEFGPPGSITVETLNGVVYLNGELDDGLDRGDIQSIVRRVAGVKKIVNNVSADNN